VGGGGQGHEPLGRDRDALAVRIGERAQDAQEGVARPGPPLAAAGGIDDDRRPTCLKLDPMADADPQLGRAQRIGVLMDAGVPLEDRVGEADLDLGVPGVEDAGRRRAAGALGAEVAFAVVGGRGGDRGRGLRLGG
jgi:hypothetical protein